MPRVVPSQVVSFMAARFPWLPGNAEPPGLTMQEMRVPFLALTRLVKSIPPALLQMAPNDYVEFEMTVSALELAIAPGRTITYSYEHLALRTLYRVLSNCPDDYPPPIAKDPAFITDPDLREDLHRDIGEVERALQNGEWKAATVLAGSVIEALLLWTCQNRPDPAALAMAASGLKVTRPIERWDLAEFVSVVHALKLISDRTRDAANQAREFRNPIHSGRAQRLAAKCNRTTALLSAGAIEAVVIDLSYSIRCRAAGASLP